MPASSDSFGTTNDAAGVNIPRLKDSGNASYGVYYNWYTATAGSGTYAIASGSAAQSICPKGWKLPTGGTINTTGNGEFQQLYGAYNNYNNFTVTTSAVLSGYRNGTDYSDLNIAGVWWSNTASTETNGYGLSFNSSSVYPLYSGQKRCGLSVRCVAR